MPTVEFYLEKKSEISDRKRERIAKNTSDQLEFMKSITDSDTEWHQNQTTFLMERIAQIDQESEKKADENQAKMDKMRANVALKYEQQMLSHKNELRKIKEEEEQSQRSVMKKVGKLGTIAVVSVASPPLGAGLLFANTVKSSIDN